MPLPGTSNCRVEERNSLARGQYNNSLSYFVRLLSLCTTVSLDGVLPETKAICVLDVAPLEALSLVTLEYGQVNG